MFFALAVHVFTSIFYTMGLSFEHTFFSNQISFILLRGNENKLTHHEIAVVIYEVILSHFLITNQKLVEAKCVKILAF